MGLGRTCQARNIIPRFREVKVFALFGRNLYQIVIEQAPLPKYEVIRQTLASGIVSGQYPPGDRLPSESMLVKAFAASRPTVNRALRELQLGGLIERRAGSGKLRTCRRGGARLHFRPADSRIGPDRNFRADLPRDGRSPARQPACSAMGKLVGRRGQYGTAGLPGLLSVGGKKSVRRCLRSAGVDPAEGRYQPRDRGGARSGRDFPWSFWIAIW